MQVRAGISRGCFRSGEAGDRESVVPVGACGLRARCGDDRDRRVRRRCAVGALAVITVCGSRRSLLHVVRDDECCFATYERLCRLVAGEQLRRPPARAEALSSGPCRRPEGVGAGRRRINVVRIVPSGSSAPSEATVVRTRVARWLSDAASQTTHARRLRQPRRPRAAFYTAARAACGRLRRRDHRPTVQTYRADLPCRPTREAARRRDARPPWALVGARRLRRRHRTGASSPVDDASLST